MQSNQGRINDTNSTQANTIPSEVVCPNCWYKFLPRSALYISQHPELLGDPVLGRTQPKRLSPDEVVKNPETNLMTDPKGWPVNERACPRCHLQIPSALLEKRPVFISVAGPPASGKTYLITVMLHELRYQLAKFFNLSLDYSDSHDVRTFTDLEDQLFHSGSDELTFLARTTPRGGVNNKVSMDGVEVEYPKPFLFSLSPTAGSIDSETRRKQLYQSFAIYDNAGELFNHMQDRDPTLRATQHLGVADALIFVFDPLQEEKIHGRLSYISDDPQLKIFQEEKSFKQHDKILHSVVASAKRLRGIPSSQKLPLPLLVCVQKYDVWKCLTSDWVNEDWESFKFFDNHGVAALNRSQINKTSIHIREFLNDYCPSFVATAESAFSTIRYFPVSAFGQSPKLDKNGLLGIEPNNLKPYHITDAILWIMQKMRIIYNLKSKPSGPTFIGEVISKNKEGFRFRFPESQKTICLDWEYAGSVVSDPSNGKNVLIPSVSN